MKKKKNILILTYWSFKDALIQTYTLPYVKIIRQNLNKESKIFLFTFEQSHLKMSKAAWNEQCVKFKESNIFLLRFPYSNFGFTAILKAALIFIKLTLLIHIKRIHTIHAWCTPAGALGYFLSLISFKPLIIDSYEPHAESMLENGTWKKNSLSYKILWWLEKKQSKKAKALIATTYGMQQYCITKYSVKPKLFFVKPSCVDLQHFNPNIQTDSSILDGLKTENKIIAVYAGKFGGIYLDQEIFDFLKVAFEKLGNRLGVIFLTNTNKEKILERIKQNELDAANFFIKFVFHHEIPQYLKFAQFAINPVKPVPTKRYCTSIKDGEYWAMGLPVIITKDISDDSEIIEEHKIGYVWNSLDENEYKKSLSFILKLIEEKDIKYKIRAIAEEKRNFAIAERIYSQIYY